MVPKLKWYLNVIYDVLHAKNDIVIFGIRLVKSILVSQIFYGVI